MTSNHRPDPPSATDPDTSAKVAFPEPGSQAPQTETIEKLEAENADLKDRLLRALADVENGRRRAAREVDDARQYAVARFAADVVNVADNLARAIASTPDADRRDAAVERVLEGVSLTERELQRILKQHGVRKLEPLGDPFDPNFHEAVFEVQDSSAPTGSVAVVVEPGYAIGSRALRAAKVGVARTAPKT